MMKKLVFLLSLFSIGLSFFFGTAASMGGGLCADSTAEEAQEEIEAVLQARHQAFLARIKTRAAALKLFLQSAQDSVELVQDAERHGRLYAIVRQFARRIKHDLGQYQVRYQRFAKEINAERQLIVRREDRKVNSLSSPRSMIMRTYEALAAQCRDALDYARLVSQFKPVVQGVHDSSAARVLSEIERVSQAADRVYRELAMAMNAYEGHLAIWRHFSTGIAQDQWEVERVLVPRHCGESFLQRQFYQAVAEEKDALEALLEALATRIELLVRASENCQAQEVAQAHLRVLETEEIAPLQELLATGGTPAAGSSQQAKMLFSPEQALKRALATRAALETALSEISSPIDPACGVDCANFQPISVQKALVAYRSAACARREALAAFKKMKPRLSGENASVEAPF